MPNKGVKRRGWSILHLSAETERIMASRFSLTTEHSHEATRLNNLISGREKRVYSDKVYDYMEILIPLRNYSTISQVPEKS